MGLVQYKKGNFPHYAGKYRERTGKELTDLIKNGFSNEEIRWEFFKVGLRRPSQSYLEYFRRMLRDPGIVAERVEKEIKSVIAEHVGIRMAGVNAVLDTVIHSGFECLKKNKVVTVSELLKAVELKDRIKEENPEEITDKVKEEIFGETENKPEEDDQGLQKGEPISEDKIPTDTEG